MTPQPQHTPIEQDLERLNEQGSDGFLEVPRILLNAARLFEREHFLQAASDERTSERRDYANGFKPKHLRTRLGELDLRIPQVRQGDFYPQALSSASGMDSTLPYQRIVASWGRSRKVSHTHSAMPAARPP